MSTLKYKPDLNDRIRQDLIEILDQGNFTVTLSRANELSPNLQMTIIGGAKERAGIQASITKHLTKIFKDKISYRELDVINQNVRLILVEEYLGRDKGEQTPAMKFLESLSGKRKKQIILLDKEEAAALPPQPDIPTAPIQPIKIGSYDTKVIDQIRGRLFFALTNNFKAKIPPGTGEDTNGGAAAMMYIIVPVNTFPNAVRKEKLDEVLEMALLKAKVFITEEKEPRIIFDITEEYIKCK